MTAPQARAPTTLAGGLALAIADGRAILARADETYRFRALQWHTPVHTSGDARPLCAVCAAGAVMVETLKIAPDERVDPKAFDKSWRNALEAIDSMRGGVWHGAWEEMYPWAPVGRHGIEFGQRIDKRLRENDVSQHAVLALANFEGADAYEQWLDWADRTLRPVIHAEERALLGAVGARGA